MGACRQLRKALRKMAAYLPSYEGVDTEVLYGQVRERLTQIEAGETVSGFPGIAVTSGGVSIL